MVQRVRKERPVLEVLKVAKPKLRKAVLAAADQSSIRTICEICHNLIGGAVPLTPDQKNKLARHKRALRMLAAKDTSLAKKRQYLLDQRGGAILPLLLSTVLGALFS